MRKAKGQTVDLLYSNNKEIKENSKTRSKNKTKNRKKKSKLSNEDNTRINLDNEIIIGLTPKRTENEKQNNKRKSKSNNKIGKTKANKNKSKKVKPKQNTKNPNIKKSKAKRKSTKNKRNKKIVKWIILTILIIMAIALFMMSSIFNIKQIVVTNNSKVSSQEIIDLSTLTPGTNMFKTTNNIIRKNLKLDPYIEEVKVKRSLNGTVTLEIKERIPTYMLKFANAYVYINNQGYMLEISESPLELPVITGFQTPGETMNAGNRLVVDDLEKLEDVIKIMESAKSISLANIITEIDITDAENYKLTIASEGKTVQFGDCSNINIKLLKIQALIEQEKGIEGEIYFQDLDKTVFREKV